MTVTPAATDLNGGLNYAMHARLAAHYERHLVDECGYCSHKVLADLAIATGSTSGPWLDLGAGSGLVGRALAQRTIRDLELTAVDLSPAMLDLIDLPIYVAKVVADCSDRSALPGRTFRGALAAGLLEHLPDPEPFVRNVAELLVPGGHFLLTFPPNRTGKAAIADHRQGLISHDVQALSGLLERHGFVIDAQREYPAYRNGSGGFMVHRAVACRLHDAAPNQ